MSELCDEYDQQAVLQRIDGEKHPRWLVRPDKCHISTQVYDEGEAARFIAETYTVTSGCRADVLHADLVSPPTTRTDEESQR